MWVTLLLFVATIVMSELMRPKPPKGPDPGGLGDIQITTATEGRVIPILWGRVYLKSPNVVWYGDFHTDRIRKSVQSGLFSKSQMTIGHRYYLGVQMALCRGQNVALRRVVVSDIEIWNAATDPSFPLALPGEIYLKILKASIFGDYVDGEGGIQGLVDFYPGNTPQTVSAFLNTAWRQQIVTAPTPTAPSYAGTCHVVLRFNGGLTGPGPNDVGMYLGNDKNIRSWEFELERFPGIFAGQGAGEHKIGNDCNPINVIYEILTNTEWGFGHSSSDIDVGAGSSFKTAADTLRTEVNGFSMALDQPMEAEKLKKLIEKQIDGVVFLDPQTGKWRVKLARADYNILLVPQLNDSNNCEVRNFTRGTWDDTTNQITVKFFDRNDGYKESFAVAQDVANAMLLAGGSVLEPIGVVGEISHPGVMEAATASNLAWRDLRAQSYPLARATFIINRQFWNLRMGDVVAWTSARFGFVRLPMRISKIDFGQLNDNKITIDTVQDVFQYEAASMGTPPATEWTPPTVSLVAYPANEQLAFEAPRGILTRDPDFGGDPDISKILSSARRQGGEETFVIQQRNAIGAPAGAFSETGIVISFMRIGELSADLAAGTAIPTATITMVPAPDGQADLESVFNDGATLTDLGVSLQNLIMVGNEFMLVDNATIAGANVNLNSVYRGVLDSVQEGHVAGDYVYLVFAGAGITDTSFPNTNNVDIELRMRSTDGTKFAGVTNVISTTMAKRAMRPYPPAAPEYSGGGVAYAVPNLEADGGPGLNDFGVDVEWRRRNFQTTDELNALLADDAGVDASTEYRVRIFVDPAGANVEVYTGAWAVGAGPVFVNRLLLLNEAAAGTMARIQIEARHDYAGEVNLPSRYNVGHEVIPTSVMTPKFYLGGNLSAGTASAVYTAPVNGNYTVRIGAAYATSNVEVQINGGGWAVVIAAGLTSGIFAALAADLIEVRHTVNEAPTLNLVQIEDPGAAVVAYGVLSN